MNIVYTNILSYYNINRNQIIIYKLSKLSNGDELFYFLTKLNLNLLYIKQIS